MTSNEFWFNIENHSNYMISNHRRIKSLLTGKITSGHLHSNGYYCVKIKNDNGLNKTKFIHRMYATIFIPNPKNKPYINHKNGIKTDNFIDNLEWCTIAENNKHAIENKLKLGTNKGKYKGEHTRARLVIDTQTGIFYDSIIEAAEAKGINKNTLTCKLTGHKTNNTSIVYV